MTKELFGTDGIRGIPGAYPLDDATLYGLARALGKYLLETEPRPRALIGMDTRESGPHIAAQLAAGLADDGVEFVDVRHRHRGFDRVDQPAVPAGGNDDEPPPFHDIAGRVFVGVAVRDESAAPSKLAYVTSALVSSGTTGSQSDP